VKPVLIENPHFRPGTHTEPKDVVFKFAIEGEKTAALGDMIAWLPAITWVAKEYNFVNGHLVVPGYFLELAKNILSPHSNWKVHKEKISDKQLGGAQLRQQIQNPANATGFHLVDLGFVYFAGINPPPEDARFYPEIDFSKYDFTLQLPENYAVITPYYEANTRRLTASTWNAIIEHLLKHGVTPVVLGRSSMDKRRIQLDEGIDLGKCHDLTNKTTLMQAAHVMKNACMVIGVDNGLLHLAAMTDATILVGYTIAGPEQRRFPRKSGHTMEMYPDKETLPCRFCQERVRFFLGHNFAECIYQLQTPDCVKLLNAESFKANIDTIMKETHGRN